MSFICICGFRFLVKFSAVCVYLAYFGVVLRFSDPLMSPSLLLFQTNIRRYINQCYSLLFFLTTAQVIGDKTAWATSAVFLNKPNNVLKSLVHNTENRYRVKMKFLHIIRNPFDIVSTITLRNTKQQAGRFADHTEKVREICLMQRGSCFFTKITLISLYFLN